MNLIVNADKNWGIGKNNELLVHIPNDMKMFRQMTTGKVVVMGRKTLESFPNGMPLPKRTKIVLTHDKDYDAKGAIVVGSKEELLDDITICDQPPEGFVFVFEIGHDLPVNIPVDKVLDYITEHGKITYDKFMKFSI